MKIVTVVGARPQFIKAAAVSRAIRAHNEAMTDGTSSANSLQQITEVIVHTGQHFDCCMSDVFFEEMNIPRPDYNLNINSMNHGAMTGRMLEKIEEVLLQEKPDFVLVYGDTNSTLAGALAAKKLHMKVVHVEAGLRSFNMRMPEEINRILTDRISDILCCPTETAVKNLQKEGYFGGATNASLSTADQNPLVVNTGDVMLDAALYYSTISPDKSNIIGELKLEHNEFALCTIHRAENTDDPIRLKQIFDALIEISKEIQVVLPIHPRTRKILESSNYFSRLSIYRSIALIEPVGYFDMIELLRRAKIVLTDSGGLQKESYFFQKPCITLRDETEWVELVETGTNILSGSETSDIMIAYQSLSKAQSTFRPDLYGGGTAASKIIKELMK